MEIVNEVLSVTQEAVWARLERDDVLRVLAVRFSLDQLMAASHLLKEWIGWRADLEDVVQTLVFEEEPTADSCGSCDGARGASPSLTPTVNHTAQIPGFGSSPRRSVNLDMAGEVIRLNVCQQDRGSYVSREVRGDDRQWEAVRKVQGVYMKQVDYAMHTGGCRSLSGHISPDVSDIPKFVQLTEDAAVTVDDDCRNNYKSTLVRPANSKIPVLIPTKTTVIGNTVQEMESLGHEMHRRTEVSEKMIKCSTPAGNCCGSVNSAGVRMVPQARRGVTLWPGISCGGKGVTEANGDQRSCSRTVDACTKCGGLNPPSSEEGEYFAPSPWLLAPTPVKTETSEQQPNTPSKYSCPDNWLLLEGKSTAVPLITFKIWKLVRIFWDVLPQFVGSKTFLGSPVTVKRLLHKEITGINRLLEQLRIRIVGIMPVINKEDRTVIDQDRSVQECTINEDLHQLKSWVARIYEDCLVEGLNKEEFSSHKYCAASVGSPQTLDNSSTSSISSNETDSDFNYSPSKGEEPVRGKYSSPYSPEDFPDIIKDDLLCWLWQAVRSDMDDDVTVHILASHYTLQEVHHSRNILASYNFSLSYMKGMRGLLYEMLWVLRSAKQENNNTSLPKFTSCNVTNRPSVRPVKWTSIARDLEFMSDMAQKITTQICWLLPEAQRYSSAMEAAGKGTLATQLSATTSTLNNLKTILDWKLGSLLNSTTSECFMAPQPVVCVQPTFTYTLDPYSREDRSFLECNDFREKLQHWTDEGLVSRCCRGGGVNVSSLYQPTTATHHHTSCRPTLGSSHLSPPQVCHLTLSHHQDIKEEKVKRTLGTICMSYFRIVL